MQALIIIVNKIEYINEIVGALKSSGIRGATIIDGLGSNAKGRRSLNTTSFLASIVEGLEQRNESKKVVISVVEKDEQVTNAIKKLDSLLNSDEEKTKGAFIFTLPINHMRGGELERHIVRRDGTKEL